MLVTFVPHCLFGCSMGMDGAAPVAIGGVMDCCDSACPMNHPDECLATEDGSTAPDAIVQGSESIVPDFVPIARAETVTPSFSERSQASAAECGPLPPPAPLNLLHAQFLI